MQTRRDQIMEHPNRLQRNLFRALTATIVAGSIVATAWSLGPIYDSLTRLAASAPL